MGVEEPSLLLLVFRKDSRDISFTGGVELVGLPGLSLSVRVPPSSNSCFLALALARRGSSFLSSDRKGVVKESRAVDSSPTDLSFMDPSPSAIHSSSSPLPPPIAVVAVVVVVVVAAVAVVVVAADFDLLVLAAAVAYCESKDMRWMLGCG